MTDEQTKTIDEATEAAESCRLRAERCARLGLTVLAREYDHFAKALAQGVAWQRRAIDGPSVITQPDRSDVIEQ